MTRFGYALALLSLVVTTAWSQDKKVAFTDPAQADADFAWQGEYAGPGWGLQVVAGGDGKFDAMLYPGGLPGAGWRKGNRFKLTGALEGDAVVLQGDQYTATVRMSQADVRDISGRLLVRLTKRTRVSPTQGLRPPAGATVLFDGSSADQFAGGVDKSGHWQDNWSIWKRARCWPAS